MRDAIYYNDITSTPIALFGLRSLDNYSDDNYDKWKYKSDMIMGIMLIIDRARYIKERESE